MHSKMPPTPLAISLKNVKNKKIVFDDSGQITSKNEILEEKEKNKPNKLKKKLSKYDERKNEHREKDEINFTQNYNVKNSDAQEKWYNVYTQFSNTSDEILDMKDNEQTELYNLCKNAFDNESSSFAKRNPSDSRWLQTALHKGTANDRANAGALLVTSNPMGNISALETLIGYSKLSNKSCSDVIGILTDLWKQVLLPPNRKLISIQLRGYDWKAVQKDTTLTKEKQRKIYAYWHFENELKDQYSEYLKNLQQALQLGQENNKSSGIISAASLLSYAPEKEQLLLSMLINKLGDPLAKIASKALHHLQEVINKHPNMCGVVAAETEKLLFRNNISDRAQHFGLCFLASIAPNGRPEVCTKLVHICFSLFKVLVQKGNVNSRTMQAILTCLKKAILEAKPPAGSTEIMTKEMQDTIYRLVHLADIRISIQTFNLLLELVTAKTENSDRFYNALYKKMIQMEITAVGNKTAAQFLHIVYRSIQIDNNINRAKAFIKRLLQLSLYAPAHMSAGCLIVIYKLLHKRSELNKMNDEISLNNGVGKEEVAISKVHANDEYLMKFDSDGEEKYKDVCSSDDDGGEIEKVQETSDDGENKSSSKVLSSWHHISYKSNENQAKIKEISISKYDPYHRVAAYSGAEFALRNELVLLQNHFHPSVKVFAENILNHKRIDYYGNPLKDFSLPHFLERFSFKNPKKYDNTNAETSTIAHKRYLSHGSRGKPVQSLTKSKCTEDEMFIFNYLEKKRANHATRSEQEDKHESMKATDVDDDEFDDYLDNFFGKKAIGQPEDDDEDLDFLQEFGDDLKKDKQNKKKKSKTDNDENDDDEWSEGDDENMSENDASEEEDDETSIDLDGEENNDDMDDDKESVSLNENDTEDGNSMSELDESQSDSNEDDVNSHDFPPKSKKQKIQVNNKSFAKTLKHSGDMSSLFAAADDFADLLEESGNTKGEGTSNAVFNKDKSSAKQMQWEENRRSKCITFTKKASKFDKKKRTFTRRK